MDRILTSRLILRGLTPRDAPLLLDFDLRNRDFLAPWESLRDEAYFTADRVLALIKSNALAARQGTSFRWQLFEHAEPGRIVGSVGLSNIVRGGFLSAHLGYRIDAAAAGRGLMTEAVAAVVEHAFEKLDLHRLEANVMPRNEPSRRLLARLGFEEEGLARKYLKIAGRWEDHLHYVRFNARLE